MKKNSFRKNLARYSALAAAAISGISAANSQILYTDRSPGDIYTNAGSPILLDIDGDGTPDFSLIINKNSYTSTVQTGSSINTYNNVRASIRIQGVLKCGNWIQGSVSADALAKPDHVSVSKVFSNDDLIAYYSTYRDAPPNLRGNFTDGNEHYLGLKFSGPTGMHYGWIRLKVEGSNVIVYDYACEETPEASIHTGGLTTIYNNAGSGNWSDAANWNKGIPSAADDALIPSGQSVTIDAPATCFNFINDGSVSLGIYTLDVGGHFKNTGNTFNEGTATINLTGDFTNDATRKITGNPLSLLGLHIYNLDINNPNVNYTLNLPTDIDNNFNLISCNYFTIEPATQFNAHRDLTIDGTLLNQGIFNAYGNVTVNYRLDNEGTFTLVSNDLGTASFLNNGEVINGMIGTFDVQKYLPDGRWWYVGSPVNGAQSSSFGSLSVAPSTGTNLYYWNEIAGSYTNLTLGTEYLDALHGYAYKNFDGTGPNTADFTGNLHDGPIGDLDNVTRTVTGIYDGYNLVSNPYPSAIDWGSAGTPTPGLVMTNLEPTIWYRTNGHFATYNWTSGTGQNTGQQIIPAMQAFWVRVASGNTTGTYNIDNQSRLHSSQAFYKKTDDPNIFRIEVSNNSLTDEAVVTFNQGAQPGYENFDSEKMLTTDDNVPQIFTLTSDNMQMAINGEPELGVGEEKIIPLGFITNIAGTFTLNASNLTTFQPGVDVYLEDALSGTITNLRQTNSYTFSSAIVNNADRFRLHFGSITTNIVSENIATAVAYSFDNTVYVNTPSDNCSIELYDMLGNLIINKLSVKGLNILQTGVSKGVYIVKIINGSDVSTEKIMIHK